MGAAQRKIGKTDGNASFLRAARAGNLEKVLEYLKGSIDINTSNANGLNALHLAAKEGHVNVVSELLKRGANVNAATKKGNTALHIASLAGQEEVVKLLVEKQANVNVQSQSGFTPLYMAAQENHDAVVRFLLAHGANQSLATEDGFTPLAVALQQGHDKVVAVLLENDARGKVRLPALHIASKKDDCKAAALLLHSEHNPDVTSKSGFTPLHIAAHYGNSNIASLLLEKGADVNFPAKHQITPLHVAAKWGKSNMVKLLLEKGAKMDASTRDGLTPLHCAARSGHDQVVEQLLEKNAPITAKTKNGLAPLHMASQGDHVDSARILLYHKAPVDDVTVDYLTALHVAAHCGHVGVAKLLLDRKADPNARALNGFTPLHIACKKNRIKVVELLLKHGASIEATTESGLTPLHVASFMGCMNIVIYLIQHGANPDIPTVRGETPLHLAARANQTDIIRILLRNGAHVDAKARELQTALHIASRLGNADMVGLLLQHGAAVDAPTKDAYTPLHVAAREGQDEVAALLLDHGAALAAPTKKGFTPLHLAAKYGNIKVAKLLLQKDAPVDAQGKNGVTPLHVAAHYDHVNVALLLLEKGASPHAAARNGYTPLHVAARKDQMDIASSLLEYGARPGAESRAGFTPLHLAAQEGHADLAALLVEHGADCDAKAKNGLTPLHLCAQEDRVNVAAILAKSGATIDPTTKAGYTPLHVACHFGQTNMIRFLLRQGANVNATTTHGYTPLHQAAQQGHTLIINLLLEHRASPNATTKQGQTALSIAQRLGYISVVETLKVVTETTVTTTITTVTEEKYKVVAPETMHETFMSDSEDEGAEDNMLGDQSFRYLTADEMKSLGDDSLPIDVTRDERLTESIHVGREPGHVAPLTQEEERLSPTQAHQTEAVFVGNYAPDNVDISRTPIHAGFLVSFLVDARGGAMRGCRHSGVRVIIPPRKAQMPMRITCRYLRKEKLPHPPPLLEGEACASRILEVGPAGAKFLGPVILEVPHFASLRGKEREITILRSDNGETWKEHTLEASEEAVQEVLNESFEGEELSALEDLQTNRITRILTTDFPQYFAVVSRTRQEVHAVGPEGGMLSSTVVPQVQAIFPEGALTKKIRVGLQAQPIQPELVTKLLGHRVAVSPIVTVEPRRRKFHKPITLTIPVPQAATKGMINQYAGDAPTLRLLCSITGGANKAQWEDVTGSTPLTFVNDCVSFTTTVSARFWLMDCRQVSEATKFATELYAEAIHVPFMAKFVVFAKRQDPMEAQLRVFCMTDDKEDKTLETQEHFSEVAKSRDVEVLENKSQYLEFAGNLVPVTKSGEQLKLHFQAFRENRVPFVVRVKDIHQEPLGRVAFMREPRAARTEPPQVPLCNLNIALPEFEASRAVSELVTLEKKYGFVEETGLAKPELIHRADLRLSDIARELGADWVPLAAQLDVPDQDVSSIRSECPSDLGQQALLMLRLWMKRANTKATGNNLEKGLRRINREDIVNKCMFNVELVTDDVEKAVAKVHLDQSGFDTFREELGAPKTSSLKRDASLDVSYDEPDLMKEAESAEETSSETGSVQDRHASSEAKGQGKGSRKGSPISAVLGRLVRGSSKEKAAPTMAVAENFDEEPTTPKREHSEKTKEGTVREASPVATPQDIKKKSKKEKSPPLPASPPSDKSSTKTSGLGSPLSSPLGKDAVVQEVVQATSVAGSKKGKTPEPKEKSVEKVPHVPSSEAAKEPPASSAMKTPGENGLPNSKPEEIPRGAPPPVPKRDVKKTPGGIVETVEVIKHQVGKVTDLFPKLGKKGKGEKGAPTISAAEPDAAKGSPAKELKETPGGVVEIVQVTKHEVAKGPEASPKKVKGKSPEKKPPPVADASTEKPSVTTKREIRETPGGLMEVVEVTKHDIGRMPEIDGTFSVGALEGDPSTVVHREVKETPGGLVEVVRVTKHEVGKLPEGESPSVLGDKIADLAKAPGGTEGEPSTLVRREVKQVPGGLVEVVEVTKHEVGKTLEDKHSPMHGKFPETQIPWEAESQISKAAPSTIVKREVKELPGGHVEVVQVTTHEVGKLPQASDLPGLGEPVCETSITQRIETQIVDGKPTIVRRIITSTPKGVTEEIEPVEPDESQPSDSSLFPKMGDLVKFKEDPSAVVKREVKEIPGGVMEVVSVTKHVTSATPAVETEDSLSSQFPPGSLITERTLSESLSDFPEGIDERPPGVTKTTVIKKEVSGPDAIVQTTTSVVTSATAPKGKGDLSVDLLDKMFGETKPSQPKDSPLKDVLTPAKVRGAAGKVTAEEAELLAQLFPEQEGAGVTMYPPASHTPEAAIIPEYRSWTAAEATSPADPETKERILLTLGRALSQDDLDAPSPTRGQAVVTPSEDEPLAKTMAFRTKPSEDTVVTSTQVKDVHDDGTVKHTVTTVTKTTIIQEIDEPGSQGLGAAPRAGESEAWASDLDTSQVSVSSLPEDEKTEPTATLSSSATTTTAERDASSSEPLLHTQVEEKDSRTEDGILGHEEISENLPQGCGSVNQSSSLPLSKLECRSMFEAIKKSEDGHSETAAPRSSSSGQPSSEAKDALKHNDDVGAIVELDHQDDATIILSDASYGHSSTLRCTLPDMYSSMNPVSDSSSTERFIKKSCEGSQTAMQKNDLHILCDGTAISPLKWSDRDGKKISHCLAESTDGILEAGSTLAEFPPASSECISDKDQSAATVKSNEVALMKHLCESGLRTEKNELNVFLAPTSTMIGSTCFQPNFFLDTEDCQSSRASLGAGKHSSSSVTGTLKWPKQRVTDNGKLIAPYVFAAKMHGSQVLFCDSGESVFSSDLDLTRIRLKQVQSVISGTSTSRTRKATTSMGMLDDKYSFCTADSFEKECTQTIGRMSLCRTCEETSFSIGALTSDIKELKSVKPHSFPLTQFQVCATCINKHGQRRKTLESCEFLQNHQKDNAQTSGHSDVNASCFLGTLGAAQESLGLNPNSRAKGHMEFKEDATESGFKVNPDVQETSNVCAIMSRNNEVISFDGKLEMVPHHRGVDPPGVALGCLEPEISNVENCVESCHSGKAGCGANTSCLTKSHCTFSRPQLALDKQADCDGNQEPSGTSGLSTPPAVLDIAEVSLGASLGRHQENSSREMIRDLKTLSHSLVEVYDKISKIPPIAKKATPLPKKVVDEHKLLHSSVSSLESCPLNQNHMPLVSFDSLCNSTSKKSIGQRKKNKFHKGKKKSSVRK